MAARSIITVALVATTGACQRPIRPLPTAATFRETLVARTVDYSAVWADTPDMLRQHSEAIVAIAGLLMLVPNWASGFFVGQPDVEGVKTVADIFAAQGEHLIANWPILLPLGLISFFGGIAVLTLLLRPELPRIGDTLLFAAKLFPVYLLVSILTGILTSLGAFAFLIGLLYIAGRLLPVMPIVVAETDKGVGIWGSIARGWELTRGLGWKCFLLFFTIIIVAYISTGVIDIIVGIICSLAGPEGVPLVQTFVSALTGSALGVVILALEAAVYRHLAKQD